MHADRIMGSAWTKTTIEDWRGPPSTEVADCSGEGADGDVLGPEALRVRLIEGDASTDTNLRAAQSSPTMPPAPPSSPTTL
jgi:hypothetical protein